MKISDSIANGMLNLIYCLKVVCRFVKYTLSAAMYRGL